MKVTVRCVCGELINKVLSGSQYEIECSCGRIIERHYEAKEERYIFRERQ